MIHIAYNAKYSNNNIDKQIIVLKCILSTISYHFLHFKLIIYKNMIVILVDEVSSKDIRVLLIIYLPLFLSITRFSPRLGGGPPDRP